MRATPAPSGLLYFPLLRSLRWTVLGLGAIWSAVFVLTLVMPVSWGTRLQAGTLVVFFLAVALHQAREAVHLDTDAIWKRGIRRAVRLRLGDVVSIEVVDALFERRYLVRSRAGDLRFSSWHAKSTELYARLLARTGLVRSGRP
jgi:hypothetical protein